MSNHDKESIVFCAMGIAFVFAILLGLTYGGIALAHSMEMDERRLEICRTSGRACNEARIVTEAK